MKEKQEYCSPQTLALALRSEGVICTSIGTNTTVTNPFEAFTETVL